MIDHYNNLIGHDETDYTKVFIRNPDVNKLVLMKRCKEWVDIKDSAEPVIEIIEKGTTDVQHMINKAQGRAAMDPT